MFCFVFFYFISDLFFVGTALVLISNSSTVPTKSVAEFREHSDNITNKDRPRNGAFGESSGFFNKPAV